MLLLSLLAVTACLPSLVLGQANPILGTKTLNISSESTQMIYDGTWRSDTVEGIYQAYSNDTDAAVTFTFVGVAAQYVATRKSDRGLCQLLVDETVSYTIDLYDGSGYPQERGVVWSSGTLPYGVHNITLMQIGPDARLGFWPYLYTETWIETVPVNVASYTATQVAPTGSRRPSAPSSGSSSTNIGPIIGGVVGGVLALSLGLFLIYLWRRDKASRARGDGVQKPRKEAAGKMAIEDETNDGAGPDPSWGGPGGEDYGASFGQGGAAVAGGYAGAGAGYLAHQGYDVRGGRHDGSNGTDWNGSSASHYGAGGTVTREGSGHSYNSQHGLLPSGAAYGQSSPPPGMMMAPYSSSASPSFGSQSAPYAHMRDPVAYRGITPDSYPHVVQGEDRRRYAVPEI